MTNNKGQGAMTQATECTTRRTLVLSRMSRERLWFICDSLHCRSPFGILRDFNADKQPSGRWVVHLEWGDNPTGYMASYYTRLSVWQAVKMAWLILMGTIGRKVDEWQR